MTLYESFEELERAWGVFKRQVLLHLLYALEAIARLGALE